MKLSQNTVAALRQSNTISYHACATVSFAKHMEWRMYNRAMLSVSNLFSFFYNGIKLFV